MSPVLNQKEQKIRLLIADNSRIHAQLLSDALENDAGIDVVTWNFDPLSFIPSVRADKIDILVINSSLRVGAQSVFDILLELRGASPETKAVILLDSQKDQDAITAFQAGARGIFNRDSSVEMFSKCIRAVHRGEIWASTREVSLVVNALASMPMLRTAGKSSLSLLSKRELEVVQCLVHGLANREIADNLGLSRHTIKNHLFRIFDKLGVSNRTELLFMMLENNGSVDLMLPAVSGNASDQNKDQAGADLEFLKRAAEDGSLAAQLALAQEYLARPSQAKNAVLAYMWYVIAMERTSLAQEFVTELLTEQQIKDAQQKAAVWLARMGQKSALRRRSISRL